MTGVLLGIRAANPHLTDQYSPLRIAADDTNNSLSCSCLCLLKQGGLSHILVELNKDVDVIINTKLLLDHRLYILDTLKEFRWSKGTFICGGFYPELLKKKQTKNKTIHPYGYT